VPRLILLGPPGAGKGTQSLNLAHIWQIPHISTGEIFRQAMQERTALGIKAQSYVDSGELVPDELVQDLVQERLCQPDTKSGWILDGFPRKITQAVFLGELLAQIGQSDLMVINLDVPDEVVISRLLIRGRQDDQAEVIARRLEVYRGETAPLINYYGDRQQLLTVSGNQPPEAVTTALQELVSQVVSHLVEAVNGQ
jgi:adenylate kinase